MNKKLKCLFLGYSSKKTILISFLRKKSFFVKNYNGNLEKINVGEYDICVSFGYRKIISSKDLKRFKRKPINLHLSYLPFNRGAHPNYWSFVENTPKGVTIHEIKKGIDTGNIILQKLVHISKEKHSFKSSYNLLFKTAESLFIKNFDKIIMKKYRSKKQKKRGTSHKTNQLPKSLKSWNVNINNYLKHYKTQLNKINS